MVWSSRASLERRRLELREAEAASIVEVLSDCFKSLLFIDIYSYCDYELFF